MGAPAVAAEIRRRAAHRSLAVFLDYDGTLCPIVDDPDEARITDTMRQAVRRLSMTAPVAVVSGRDREDVARRVGLPELCYAGSHGFDIRCPAQGQVHPAADEAVPALDAAEARLRQRLSALPGVRFERKRFSFAVHYRQVPAPWDAEVRRAAVEEARASAALKVQTGKQVYDLVPDVDWDKGRAVRWILAALGLDRDDTAPLYLGDDDTDVSAFRAVEARGVSVGVGDGPAAHRAQLWLASHDEVERLLFLLAERPPAGTTAA